MSSGLKYIAWIILQFIGLQLAALDYLEIEEGFTRQRISGNEAFVDVGPHMHPGGLNRGNKLVTPFKDAALEFDIRVRRKGPYEEMVLAFEDPAVYQINVQVIKNGMITETLKGGMRYNYKYPFIRNRLIELPFSLKQNESAVLRVQIQNQGFRRSVPVILYQKENLSYRRSVQIGFFSLYFSIIFFILFFGFIIQGFIKVEYRWSYLLYNGLIALFVAALSGVGYQLVWHRAPVFQNLSTPMLMNALLLSGFIFQQILFRLPKIFPKINLIVRALIIVHLLFAFLAIGRPFMPQFIIAPYQWANDFLILISSCFFVYVPIRLTLRTRSLESVWFALAYVAHILGLFVLVLESIGLMVWPFNLTALIWAGTSWMHFALAIMVLGRVRRVMQDNNKVMESIANEKVGLIRELVLQDEMERERVGADLHDEAGSRFASIKIMLSGLLYDLEKEQGKDKVEIDNLQSIIDEVDALCVGNRELSHRMLSGSLERLGLEEALQELKNRLLKKGRFVHFDLRAETLLETGKTFAHLLYRVLEELVLEVFDSSDHFRVIIRPSYDQKNAVVHVEGIDKQLATPDQDKLEALRTRISLFAEYASDPISFDENGLEIRLPIVKKQKMSA